ncbi:unnamed protein product [Arctogadus glacialis]
MLCHQRRTLKINSPASFPPAIALNHLIQFLLSSPVLILLGDKDPLAPLSPANGIALCLRTPGPWSPAPFISRRGPHLQPLILPSFSIARRRLLKRTQHNKPFALRSLFTL